MQSGGFHRQNGNAAYAKGKFALAVDHYSSAIAQAGDAAGRHTLFSNRSVFARPSAHKQTETEHHPSMCICSLGPLLTCNCLHMLKPLMMQKLLYDLTPGEQF